MAQPSPWQDNLIAPPSHLLSTTSLPLGLLESKQGHTPQLFRMKPALANRQAHRPAPRALAAAYIITGGCPVHQVPVDKRAPCHQVSAFSCTFLPPLCLLSCVSLCLVPSVSLSACISPPCPHCEMPFALPSPNKPLTLDLSHRIISQGHFGTGPLKIPPHTQPLLATYSISLAHSNTLTIMGPVWKTLQLLAPPKACVQHTPGCSLHRQFYCALTVCKALY